MNEQDLRVVRVFNNNVLLVSARGSERVVVGRGIGFGRHAGDSIPVDTVQQSYVELNSERQQFLEVASEIDPRLLETISSALDLANDLLGDLHPSVYLLLADHLVFAVQQLGAGRAIRDSLTREIEAVFPQEYGVAQMVLHYINSRIPVHLPESEAGFIALHLQAARTGDAVKKPLEQANELARLIDDIGVMLRRNGVERPVDHEFSVHLAHLVRNLRTKPWRVNAAQRSIERDLSDDVAMARSIIARILDVPYVPAEAGGEVAFLAVFCHGWRQ